MNRVLAIVLYVLYVVRRRFAKWRKKPAFEIDAMRGAEVNQVTLLRATVRDLLNDRRAERRTGLAKALLYALAVLLPMLFFAGPALRSTVSGWLWSSEEVVAVIKLQGEMADGARASASRLVPALRKAYASPQVRAVVIEIDSPGGSPLEAERIYSVLNAERKANPKPTIAVINNIGASAAYMVALHCDQIYAGKYSLVGSVGAIISAWDFHKALDRLDVGQRVYTSGSLKAMLNPYLPMTGEADRKARDLVQQVAKQFVGELEQQRGRKLAKGVDFSTGEVWGGAEAQRIGLVDEVGTLEEVVRARWPAAKLKTFGSPEPGALPFAETAAQWMRGVVSEALEPRVRLQ